MKLRELRHGPISSWPPMWGGSYGRGDRFAIGEVGTLKAVEPARGMPGLHIEIEFEGRTQSGIMQWEGNNPPMERVIEVLRRHIGQELRGLGEIELG